MCIVQLGSDADYLTLSIHGRSQPESQNYWEANWLHCTAVVSAGALRCKQEWQIRNEDLARFKRSLEKLVTHSSGEAILDTLDGWLDIRILKNAERLIEVQCHLVDNPDGGNTLEFSLFMDHAVLSVLIDQLNQVLDCFPVVGEERA